LQFSDAARLLSFYQLWLDDLFPKAKFLDALAMVEKAGHKTMMLSQRKEWMAEARRQAREWDEGDVEGDAELWGATSHERQEQQQQPPSHLPSNGKTGDGTPTQNGADGVLEDGEDDLSHLTPQRRQQEPPASGGKTAPEARSSTLIGDDDDEEFESLLKEMEDNGNTSEPKVANSRSALNHHPSADALPDGFEDDEAALADMGLW
jgi:replication fork protection complex subunit Csm3/Swi3